MRGDGCSRSRRRCTWATTPASGDSGSHDAQNGSAVVDYPASDQFVTGLGTCNAGKFVTDELG